MSIRVLVDTLLLITVAVGALLHLNAMRERPWCERIGFAIIAGGAAGSAAEYWWPLESTEFISEFLLHIGLALVAVSIARGEISTLFDDLVPRQARGVSFLERRRNPWRDPRPKVGR